MVFLTRWMQVSWANFTSHVSFFSGIGMLWPVLVDSAVQDLAPWRVHPWAFSGAALLIVGGILAIFWIDHSLSKLFRAIGLMLLAPGMLGLLFSFVASDMFFDVARNSITGFAVVEPGVHWVVAHSVPVSVNVSAAYMFFGIIFFWLSVRVYKMSYMM